MERRDFLKSVVALPAIGFVTPADDRPQSFGWDLVLKRVDSFCIFKYGKPLSNHPAVLRQSDVRFSEELFHNYVAQAWGCTPTELYKVSNVDRIEIYAWYIANQQIKAVEM